MILGKVGSVNTILTALQGWKTYIAAGATVLTELTLLLDGKVDVQGAAQIIIPAILAACIRHGVTTEAAK